MKDIKFSTFDFSQKSSFALGGKTNFFCHCKTEESVKQLFEYSKESMKLVQVVGDCSNLVAVDKPSGIIARMGDAKYEILSHNDHYKVEVGASFIFEDLAEKLTKKSLIGIAHLAGIPGHVGAAPVQNIGAYGHEVGEIIESVRAFDTTKAKFVTLKKSECDFSYRSSRFNGVDRNRYWIFSVTFKLKKADLEKVAHKEIVAELGKTEASPSQILNAIKEVRHRKGMLRGPEYPKSAGSFFKNPIIAKEQYLDIEKKLNEDVPYYDVDSEAALVKIPAAYLIGKAGFPKGYVHKGVGISPFHNLSLINLGNGTSTELLELARLIQDAVYNKFGIVLKMEPVLIL